MIMSANVETMFYVREKPWHGLGTMVAEAPTSKDAIRLAGLDWEVESRPIFDQNGVQIPSYWANTRSTDGAVFGVVKDKYQIVQNADAFDFTDSLLGEGITYETAGSLCGGKKIWLLARMPERMIAGDKFEPYLCFTNSHDGQSAIRVCMTPVRVVCNNTLNIALEGADRKWSTYHTGDMNAKLAEARHTLLLADEYLNRLDETADRMANTRMTDGEIKAALDELFPTDADASDRQRKAANESKAEVIMCMIRPDLAQFMNTQWGFVNAVSDFVGHVDPQKKMKNWEENRWNRIMGGHRILDKAVSLVAA